MQFRKTAVLIIVGVLGAGTLAACAVEETPTKAEAAKVEKALKKHAKKAKKAEPTGPKETLAQENARESGESYLVGPSSFSRSGLIHQLKFEGFSKADATYAVDAIDPNWNKQAAKSAKSYMEGPSSFSASGLQHQLEFEGFTAAQAAHGLDAVGY